MYRLAESLLPAISSQTRSILFLSLLTLTPLIWRDISAETRQLTVVQETAPLFKEPSISSPIIKYLEKGYKLNLLAVQDSFYLVSYGGHEGWIIPYSVEGSVAGPPGEGSVPGADAATGSDSATEDEQLESGRYLVVINSYANIREGPGLSYKHIGKVFKGDRLEKFIKRGRWYRVRLPDSKIGFVREDLVADPSALGEPEETAPARPAAETAGSSAPTTGQIYSLARRIDKLESQMAELRKLLEDHKQETGKLLLEFQRSKGAPGRSGYLQQNLGLQGLTPGEPAPMKIIGNTVTKIYHLPLSVFYDKIPEEYRVYFDTEQRAVQAGYTKSIK
ncbi:MAG: SH3 domain-containing protein [Gemmatimonadota bacterium]|nr:SH3 domain-containing protein [Gemmatimonadota bacterium]